MPRREPDRAHAARSRGARGRGAAVPTRPSRRAVAPKAPARSAPASARPPRPDRFREHLFRLDRAIDEIAARAGVSLDESGRTERVEGLLEGALETWAELARQAEEMIGSAPSLASIAESVGSDPAVRSRATALLRQAGLTWLKPRARFVERVPSRGAVVLAAVRVGEPSGWDALALRLVLGDDPPGRAEAGLLVDPGLLASPVVSAAADRTGGGAIDRRAALDLLRGQGAVVAFVADRASRVRTVRARAGDARPAGKGTIGTRRFDERAVVRIALRARATIVPVAVTGGSGRGLLGRLSPIARGGSLDLSFGSPMRSPARRGGEAVADAAQVARLARDLRELLREVARGAAADRSP